MSKINEKELHLIFEQLRNEENGAYELLYEKYRDLVFKISFSILKNKENSEDISQEVFKKILQLDKDKFPTQGEASWLYTVTKNEVIQFLRKQKKIVDIDEMFSLESDSNEIDDIVDMNSYYNLIKNLKPIEQEIISLRILSDFTFEKISQLLNLPLGTVEWKYYKSLHSIKLSIANLAAFIIAFALYKKEVSINDTNNSAEKNEENMHISDFGNLKDDSSFSTSFNAGDSSGVSVNKNIISYSIIIQFLCIFFAIFTVFFGLKKKIKKKK